MTVTLDTTFRGEDKCSYSNGDLTFTMTATGSDRFTRATEAKSSGKWYWEVTIGTVGYNDLGVGLADSVFENDWSFRDSITYNTWGVSKTGASGKCFCNSGTCDGAHAAIVTGMVLGFAWDADAHELWMSEDGVWNGTGTPNPETGVSPNCTDATGTLYPCVSASRSSEAYTFNFGGSDFAYTKPSGFDSYDQSTSTTGWDAATTTTPGSPSWKP